MSKVYITQDSGHNFSPAMQYGDPVIVANRDYPIFNPSKADEFLDHMMMQLSSFDPDNDYLLLVGDPVVIGMAMSLITHRHRSFRILKWDNQMKGYNVITLNV